MTIYSDTQHSIASVGAEERQRSRSTGAGDQAVNAADPRRQPADDTAAAAPAPSEGIGELSVLEERYQHALERLVQCWGDSAYFAEVFDDLIIDRRGTRTGWPLEAWSELVFLQCLHDGAYGPRPVFSVQDV